MQKKHKPHEIQTKLKIVVYNVKIMFENAKILNLWKPKKLIVSYSKKIN